MKIQSITITRRGVKEDGDNFDEYVLTIVTNKGSADSRYLYTMDEVIDYIEKWRASFS